MRKTGSTLMLLIALVMLAACGDTAQPVATNVPATTIPTAAMAGESPTAMAAESPTAMAAESPTAMTAAMTPSAVMTATKGPAVTSLAPPC